MNNPFNATFMRGVDGTMAATVTVSESDLLAFGKDEMARRIFKELADQWVKEFGAELLQLITPEAVEKAVKQNLAERVLK